MNFLIQPPKKILPNYSIAPNLPRRLRNKRRRGSVLLEVVLALALFVAAATIITSGINASIQAVYRLRLETHAVNLAISLLSELQMRARPVTPAGPEPCAPPFTNWNFRIELTQPEGTDNEALIPVEVIVSHAEEPVVHRLTQLFRAAEIAAATNNPAQGEP